MNHVVVLALVIVLVSCAMKTYECGERLPRVANGLPANIEMYPYVVSIQNPDGIHKCGGTILTENIILTAAHCSHVSYQIRAGSTYFESEGSIHRVVRSVTHAKFDPEKFVNDISLLQVEPIIPLNNLTTRKVQLLKKNATIKNASDATVVGWGATRLPRDGDLLMDSLWDWLKILIKSYPMDHFYSSHLRIVDLQISNEICTKSYGMKMENQICAFSPGKDVCRGDSGGPLLIQNFQVGIVAWGFNKCSSQNMAGAYTNVSAFDDWITEHVRILLEKPEEKSAWDCLFEQFDDILIEF